VPTDSTACQLTNHTAERSAEQPAFGNSYRSAILATLVSTKHAAIITPEHTAELIPVNAAERAAEYATEQAALVAAHDDPVVTGDT
jgi:hypothetical protein